MIRKILSLAIILLFASACLPRAGYFPNRTPSEITSPGQAVSSPALSSQPQTMPSPEPGFSQMETPADPEPLMTEEGSLAKVEFPIAEESNDDFEFETSPENQPPMAPTFDIPIVMNAKVEEFIEYFQTDLKDKFSLWLSVSSKYIPLMRNLLKENGLPEDLVYLALIESGFNPNAYSRRKATGPWQFIYPTGKRYGLSVNWWVDERRDPEKSTIAAAKYLKDLYDLFECWYLAAASYNAGEGKISRAMKRYRTEDFWELSKYRYLKRETKNYVPQMIAAALVAKDPEAYGFVDIEYQDPLCYDKVKVPEVTTLGLIAEACEASAEELKELNPELLRGCTPPGVSDYEVRIPCGRREVFVRNFEALQPLPRFQFKTHIVRKGDTLSGIAKRYRVDIQPLLEINKLRKNSRLSIGMNLLIPIPLQQARTGTVLARETSDGDGRKPHISRSTLVGKRSAQHPRRSAR